MADFTLNKPIQFNRKYFIIFVNLKIENTVCRQRLSLLEMRYS